MINRMKAPAESDRIISQLSCSFTGVKIAYVDYAVIISEHIESSCTQPLVFNPLRHGNSVNGPAYDINIGFVGR